MFILTFEKNSGVKEHMPPIISKCSKKTSSSPLSPLSSPLRPILGDLYEIFQQFLFVDMAGED